VLNIVRAQCLILDDIIDETMLRDLGEVLDEGVDSRAGEIAI
jgi:hypothetical protein